MAIIVSVGDNSITVSVGIACDGSTYAEKAPAGTTILVGGTPVPSL